MAHWNEGEGEDRGRGGRREEGKTSRPGSEGVKEARRTPQGRRRLLQRSGKGGGPPSDNRERLRVKGCDVKRRYCGEELLLL
jgi:hypothetical protein